MNQENFLPNCSPHLATRAEAIDKEEVSAEKGIESALFSSALIRL
jgi:hypothetical protein